MSNITSVSTVIYLKASAIIKCKISQSYYPRNGRNITTVYFYPRQQDINSQENIRQYHNIQSFYQSIQSFRRIFMKISKIKAAQHSIKDNTSNHSLKLV